MTAWTHTTQRAYAIAGAVATTGRCGTGCVGAVDRDGDAEARRNDFSLDDLLRQPVRQHVHFHFQPLDLLGKLAAEPEAFVRVVYSDAAAGNTTSVSCS